MDTHEALAVTYYGLDHNIDTSQWNIHAIPAEHLDDFRAYVIERRSLAIERRNEPDDPADLAWWNERIMEWNDILYTLREAKHD